MTRDCAINIPETEMLSWGLTQQGAVSDHRATGTPPQAVGAGKGTEWGPPPESPRAGGCTQAQTQRGSIRNRSPGAPGGPTSHPNQPGGPLTKPQLGARPSVTGRPLDRSLSPAHPLPAALGHLLLNHFSVCCWKMLSHLQTQVLPGQLLLPDVARGAAGPPAATPVPLSQSMLSPEDRVHVHAPAWGQHTLALWTPLLGLCLAQPCSSPPHSQVPRPVTPAKRGANLLCPQTPSFREPSLSDGTGIGSAGNCKGKSLQSTMTWPPACPPTPRGLGDAERAENTHLKSTVHPCFFAKPASPWELGERQSGHTHRGFLTQGRHSAPTQGDDAPGGWCSPGTSHGVCRHMHRLSPPWRCYWHMET